MFKKFPSVQSLVLFFLVAALFATLIAGTTTVFSLKEDALPSYDKETNLTVNFSPESHSFAAGEALDRSYPTANAVSRNIHPSFTSTEIHAVGPTITTYRTATIPRADFTQLCQKTLSVLTFDDQHSNAEEPIIEGEDIQGPDPVIDKTDETFLEAAPDPTQELGTAMKNSSESKSEYPLGNASETESESTSDTDIIVESETVSDSGSDSSSEPEPELFAPWRGSVSRGQFMGRLKIPAVGVDVACYYGCSQSITDKSDSAAMFHHQKHIVIADHKNQGFNAIKSCTVGTKAYISGVSYTCVAITKGYNTYINDSSTRKLLGPNYETLDTMYPGALVCYTCNENSTNITLVFFQLDA